VFSRTSLLAAVLLAAALLLLSVGCSPGTVDQEYIDFADTAAEQYLISINEKDFESFSEHLGTEMKEALPE